MRWSFLGLGSWICLLATASWCEAQAWPPARATAGVNDTYCFGCPPEALSGLHPHPAEELITLAKSHRPELRQAIEETYPEKAIELGRVWSGHLHDFFFVVKASARPDLIFDDQPEPQMQPLKGTDMWVAVVHVEQLGTLHDFHYRQQGENFGGAAWNVAAFTELSYPLEGEPHGQLSQMRTLTSKVFDGVENDYCVYVPAGYDPRIPAAVTVVLDGGTLLLQQGGSSILDVVDNLIYLKKIPMMLLVFLDPGRIGATAPGPLADEVRELAASRRWPPAQAMRSVQEDVISDAYPRLLRDELFPEIAAHYNLRKDGYSHAIMGLSSGGLAAFNTAWKMPDDFSRVICGIGSFVSLQWKTHVGAADGGQDYPDKVLEEQHRNLRVWIEDGSGDLESDQYGSWPLNNLRMSNALKLKGYDFHLSFGKGGHGPEQIEVQFPEELIWLWRDYDAAKTQQEFDQDAGEKAQPIFRVGVVNRDAE